MRDGEGGAPRQLPRTSELIKPATPNRVGAGASASGRIWLVSPRRFRFPFPLNGSLLASTTRLSRLPGLSASAAPARPLTPCPSRWSPARARDRLRQHPEPRAQRGPRRVPGPGATPARQWQAQRPPLRAGATASPELSSRVWGQRCCFSPTGCCSGRRCPECHPCWCPPRCRCSGSG